MSVSKPYISKSVIRRLPRYYDFLGVLLKEGVVKISSRQLSEKMAITASQIRQDLNCFGGFGQQGYGYNVAELRAEIENIIGLQKPLPAVLIGMGNIGRALTSYFDFTKYGIRLCGIFDCDKKLTGIQVSGVTVMMIDSLEDFCEKEKPQVAILCIPKESVEHVCERLLALDIRKFWNFSHFDINIRFDNVICENVHLGDSLLTLVYNSNN